MPEISSLDRPVGVPTTHAVGVDILVFPDQRAHVRPADVLAMLDEGQRAQLGDLIADSWQVLMNGKGMHIGPEDFADVRRAVADRCEALYEDGYGYEDTSASSTTRGGQDA